MKSHEALGKAWHKPKEMEGYKELLIGLRSRHTITRVEKPLRLDRAHSVGYKAKPGFITVHVKIKKGGRKRRQVHRGRKPSKMGIKGFTTKKSLQLIAEERANKKYPNCEVLNSYWLAEDGRHKWFEVILLDRINPSVLSDSEASRVVKRRKRVYRGLTKSGRKMRGLL